MTMTAKYMTTYNDDGTVNQTGPEVGFIKVYEGEQIWVVPMSLENRHYAEIMRQVEAGELTIQDAD